jgi:hypothetical protein
LDGKAPPQIKFAITDVVAHSSYDPVRDGPLPNNTFILDMIACGTYYYSDNYIWIRLRMLWQWELLGWCKNLDNAWFWKYPPSTDPIDIYLTPDLVGSPFNLGRLQCDLGLDGSWMPPGWDAAELVGVPESAGYFAEELDTDIAHRKLRYSNHFDGTNVKVYLEDGV